MKKDNVEEIITKDDTEENIHRVDKRPGSIFSIVIFAMVFLVGYLFYPQISMLIPVPGTKLTVETSYQATTVSEMKNADAIVIATVKEKGKTKSYINSEAEPIVFKAVTCTVTDVLKGENVDEITVPEYGGNALFETGGKKQKFTVTYENSAELKKGETYLLFISNGEILNGRAGALLQDEDGVFTDATGQKYTLDQVRINLTEVE